jgi:hypothetical protein
MAKTRFIQSSFVSGELSPLLKGRIDINQYYQAVETADNVVIVPQGGMRRRPGTSFVGQGVDTLVVDSWTGTMPNGGTVASLNDNDRSTSTQTTTPPGTTTDWVFVDCDVSLAFGNIVFIEVTDMFATAGSTSDMMFQYSTDGGTTWVDQQAIPLIGTNPQNFRFPVDPASAITDWRIIRDGSDSFAGNIGASGVNYYYSGGNRDSRTKLESFEVEADRNYLVEFTPENIRIYRTNATTGDPVQRVIDILPIWNAYPAGFLSFIDVENIRVATVENVMLIVGNFQPLRLVNLGTDTDWSLDEIPFTNVPQFDYDDAQSPTPTSEIQVMTLGHTGSGQWKRGDRFEVDIESVVSKSISYAGDSTPDEQAATVFNIQKNLQEMPVFGETGVAVERTGSQEYTITISGESAKDFELFSAYVTEGSADHEIDFTKTQSGSPRKEDVWSSTRGWPKTICFYEGRLVIGGTASKPQSLFLSKSSDFFNFDIEEADDDDAIFATISSRTLNDIVDVYPGRNLQVFTSGAEFAVTSKPVTPSNIQITPQTSHGASNVEVQDVDGSTIFIDRFGKALLTFLYSFNEDAYTSDDRSVLASHLIKQPRDMALLAGTASDDANWLFVVNDDGTATVLNTLRSQDINGFTSWTMDDAEVTNVTTVGEKLFMVVGRNLGPSAGDISIEQWDFTRLLDSSVRKTATSGTIDGLEHLEGETVLIVTRGDDSGENDGFVLADQTVSGGSITLPAPYDTGYSTLEYEVGRRFIPTIKPMPLNTNIGSGQNQMRLKKIVRMNVRVYESSGINIDGIPVPIRAFGPAGDESPLSPESITPVSGIIEDVYDINGWGREVIPTITCPDPTPMHIQMIEYEVEGN